MEFCPKCNNIMDISRTPSKMIVQEPTTISQTTTENIKKRDDEYLKVINMFKNQIDLTGQKINVDELQKHKDFVSLKDKDKKDLLNILKTNEDDSLNAYYICKNCSHSERLIKRTNVLNKMYMGSVSGYNNVEMFKYYVNDKTLPHTRDYVCRNKSCQTHNNPEKKDAKWFRTNQNSYTTYYACTVCETVWNIA